MIKLWFQSIRLNPLGWWQSTGTLLCTIMINNVVKIGQSFLLISTNQRNMFRILQNLHNPPGCWVGWWENSTLESFILTNNHRGFPGRFAHQPTTTLVWTGIRILVIQMKGNSLLTTTGQTKISRTGTFRCQPQLWLLKWAAGKVDGDLIQDWEWLRIHVLCHVDHASSFCWVNEWWNTLRL